jgi:hypothetical protein
MVQILASVECMEKTIFNLFCRDNSDRFYSALLAPDNGGAGCASAQTGKIKIQARNGLISCQLYTTPNDTVSKTQQLTQGACYFII